MLEPTFEETRAAKAASRPITGGGRTYGLSCGLQLGVLRLLARAAVRAG